MTSKVDKNFIVRVDGSVLKFDPRDDAPNIDLSKETFDLTGVPPEARFMIGKIYRGQFKANRRQLYTGAIWYFLLEQWSKDDAVFVVSQWSGGSGKSKILRNTCSSFKLTDDQFASPKCIAGNVGNGWKFIDTKRGAFVFAADDGYEIEANEIGALPPEVLTKATE